MRNCTKLYSAGIPNANSLAHKRKLPSFLRQVGTTQFRGNFNSVPFPFFFSILNPWLELVVRWQLCKPDITRWRSYTRRWRNLTKITIGSVAVESSSSSQSRAVMFISLETTGEFDSFHSDIKRTVTTTTLFQQSKKNAYKYPNAPISTWHLKDLFRKPLLFPRDILRHFGSTKAVPLPPSCSPPAFGVCVSSSMQTNSLPGDAHK